MPDRPTERAVAQAAPLETARRAAGARGAGPQVPLVAELRRAGLLPLLVLDLLSAALVRQPAHRPLTELTGG